MATDFTSMGVQDMMKMYYCEPLHCALGCLGLSPSAALLLAADFQTSVLSALFASPCCAARLFPHQEMFKWLAYGNGEERSHCLHVFCF